MIDKPSKSDAGSLRWSLLVRIDRSEGMLKRIAAAKKKLDEELLPDTRALLGSSRITAEDLAIRIVSRD